MQLDFDLTRLRLSWQSRSKQNSYLTEVCCTGLEPLPSHHLPATASLNERLFCVLHVLFILLGVAIAAHALFEGVRPLIFTEHACSSRNLIMGGGSNIEGEQLACQLHFRSTRKQKKMLLVKVVYSLETCLTASGKVPGERKSV